MFTKVIRSVLAYVREYLPSRYHPDAQRSFSFRFKYYLTFISEGQGSTLNRLGCPALCDDILCHLLLVLVGSLE
jgi:hypothetical protein